MRRSAPCKRPAASRFEEGGSGREGDFLLFATLLSPISPLPLSPSPPLPLSPSHPFPNAVHRFFRYVVLPLDVLLAGLFLLGYAARYVHPHYGWWMELIAVGLPYLSVGVIVMGVVVAVLRRWRIALAHAVLLVLIGVRFVSPGGGAPEPQPGDLTIMTLNMPAHLEASPPEEQAHRLRLLAQRVEPDIIAMQETRVRYRTGPGYPLSGATLQLASLLDTLHYRPARLSEVEKERRDGRLVVSQPVLGRIPLEEQTYIRLETDDPQDRVSYVTRVEFRWHGRRAVLYNVHLRSYGPAKPWEENGEASPARPGRPRYLAQYRDAIRYRAQEVEHLRRLIEQETLPVLVAGDFNSTPHSWAYRQLSRGMQDAFAVAGSGWGATYHAARPFARIDFVLAGPAWEIVSAEVPDVHLSDHRPLVVRLRWR